MSAGVSSCVCVVGYVMSCLLYTSYGKTIEHMTSIFPNKTNVTFVEFVRKDYIKIREWERGTGETIGCGTGLSLIHI